MSHASLVGYTAYMDRFLNSGEDRRNSSEQGLERAFVVALTMKGGGCLRAGWACRNGEINRRSSKDSFPQYRCGCPCVWCACSIWLGHEKPYFSATLQQFTFL